MKKILIALAALIPAFAMADQHEEKAPAQQEAAIGAYRHVVILKFKEDATREQITEVEKEFVALKDKINTVTELEWGTDVSPESRAQGYTHCFIVSFKDRAGLDVYAPHEAHEAFKKILIPVLDKVFVIDFVAR